MSQADGTETDTAQTLTPLQFQQSEGVDDWRVLGGGTSTWYDTSSHLEGARLATALAERVGGSGLPADVAVDLDIRGTGVRVRLPLTPEDGGVRPEHVDAARAVSAAAAALGLRADPAAVQDVQLAFDVLDQAAVAPFWQTALGYDAVGEEDLLDPDRRHSPIWFQDMDAPRPLRNRIHLDVVTPQEVAVETLTRLEEQGGTAARHGYYATVADPEGNEVDVLPLPEGADHWEGPGTEDWRLVFAATACYPTPSARSAAELAEAAAALADEAGLPLRIGLRPGLVILDSGKDGWEMHEGYEALAARVQEAARLLGLTADTRRPRFVQVGLDAVDKPAVRDFWRAALAYEDDPREHLTEILDPRGLNLTLFVQDMDADDEARRAQRNRIHVDVFVPHDQAQARIDAILRAGGRVVRDADAPDGVTLADPEGNEVDIAVSVGREERWAAAHAG